MLFVEVFLSWVVGKLFVAVRMSFDGDLEQDGEYVIGDGDGVVGGNNVNHQCLAIMGLSPINKIEVHPSAIIMGDFNDVRTMDERLGSSFNASSARCFDRFIVSSGLVDVKLEGWIRGTFTSSMASILVNGSPTSEFPFCCGLKQGDPLAPYLFILIMESLHISFSRVVDDGLFKGFQLHGSVNISHLFYADDAMFIGEWSEQNLNNIVKVLNCFHLASARIGSGCAVLNTPVSLSWCDVGESSKLNGGLGVSSFFALNRAPFVEVGVALSFLAMAPLCFPRLFALELDKEIVVANKMGASSVSASFRRDVFDRAERQQWDDLSSQL
ncbi:RNA-directed DNA polymerase, eukaryota [Tanacetum coccineum]